MPEELRDMMDDASDGPIPSLDPDDLWKRGSRQRHARQLAILAPVVVLVLLIGGLAVATRDNTGGGTEDVEDGAVFADLSPEQTAIVDRYLASLEGSGQRSSFTDDRAAVEYAWRVACFGDISPIELDALGVATIDLVGAMSSEAIVGSAEAVGEATPDELAAARELTDRALAAYRPFVDGDDLPGAPDQVLNAGATAGTRLDDFDTIREAVDGRQMSVRNWTQQITETSGSAVDYLNEAVLLSADLDAVRGWGQVARLLYAQVAWSNLTGSFLGLPLDVPHQSTLSDEMAGLVGQHDETLSSWEQAATPEAKSFLRNSTSTEEMRRNDAEIDEVLLLLDTLDREQGTTAGFAEANPNPELAADLLMGGRTRLAIYDDLLSLPGAVPEAAGSDDALTLAVDAACAATDDEILSVDPAFLSGAAPADTSPTTADLLTGAAPTTGADLPATTESIPELPDTSVPPSPTSEPATTDAPTTEPAEAAATTELPASQPDVSEPAP